MKTGAKILIFFSPLNHKIQFFKKEKLKFFSDGAPTPMWGKLYIVIEMINLVSENQMLGVATSINVNWENGRHFQQIEETISLPIINHQVIRL